MKRLAIILCSLLLSFQAWGQQASLRILPNSLQVTNLSTAMSGTDTVFMSIGDSLLIEAEVVLSGPPSIVDEIGFAIAQDSFMAVGTDSIYAGFPPDTLIANDTVLIQIQDRVDSTQNRYSGGTGGGALVVVVWPVLRANQSSTETSASIIFNFGDPTSIEEPWWKANARIQYFPNPVQDLLYFQQLEPIQKFEYVRISALDGRVLFKEKNLPPWVDMSSWPGGMYLLELRYGDGKREVTKLQKR